MFKIKPKECIQSRETYIPQNIPSAGWGYNLAWLLTAARDILSIKYKPMNGFLPAPPHAPQVQILSSRHHILLTSVFLTERKIKSHFKNNKSISKRSKQTIYCYTFLVVLLCLFLVFMVSPTWIKNNTFINDLYLYRQVQTCFCFLPICMWGCSTTTDTFKRNHRLLMCFPMPGIPPQVGCWKHPLQPF